MKKTIIALVLIAGLLLTQHIAVNAGNENRRDHKKYKITSTPTPTERECEDNDGDVDEDCVTPTVTKDPTETPTPIATASASLSSTSNNSSDGGSSNSDDKKSVPTCDTPKPGNVDWITVDSQTPNDGKILLNWSLPLRAHTVNIRYSEVDGDWRYALRDYPNDGHVEIGGLKNNTSYWFQIQGIDGCAYGEYSKSVDPRA